MSIHYQSQNPLVSFHEFKQYNIHYLQFMFKNIALFFILYIAFITSKQTFSYENLQHILFFNAIYEHSVTFYMYVHHTFYIIFFNFR